MASTFCALGCRVARVGNYEVVPRGKVLTTEAFIQLRVPSIAVTGHVTLDIPHQDLVSVLVHFGKELNVMFLYLSAEGCRRVRQVLGMRSRHSLYLENCAGQEDSQRRITLLLEAVRREEVATVRKQLGTKFFSMPQLNASNILKTSKPRQLSELVGEEELVLRAKRSLTGREVFLVWQEAMEDSAILLEEVVLEVQELDLQEWRVVEVQKLAGASASAPMCVRCDVGKEVGRRRYRLRATGVEGRRWWSNVAELEL